MARRKQSLMIGTNCSETSGGNVFEVKHLLASPELRSSYIKSGQNLLCLWRFATCMLYVSNPAQQPIFSEKWHNGLNGRALHKDQPGSFIQCDLILTGTLQYFCACITSGDSPITTHLLSMIQRIQASLEHRMPDQSRMYSTKY